MALFSSVLMCTPSFLWLFPRSELTLMACMVGASEARCMSQTHYFSKDVAPRERARGYRCLYSPNFRQGVFSEIELPVYGVLAAVFTKVEPLSWERLPERISGLPIHSA